MKIKTAQLSSKKRFATSWGELADICKKIHRRLYEEHDESAAHRYESRLERVLDELPKSDLAILRVEGLALLHELRGQLPAAIKHRKKEIELMQRLHDSVQNSVKSGEYDEKMATSILKSRDQKVLQKRLAILSVLESRANEKEATKVKNGRHR